jgi:hypothetical protein
MAAEMEETPVVGRRDRLAQIKSFGLRWVFALSDFGDNRSSEGEKRGALMRTRPSASVVIEEVGAQPVATRC